MTEQAVSPHVQFAGLIVELADKEKYDFGTIFSGLAIAAASYLADYTVDSEGNVRTEDVDEATAKFVQTLQQATKFATEQVKQIVAASKAAE